MNLFVFGIGYTAGHYLRHHAGHFDSVSGTVRSADKIAALAADRIHAVRFDPPEADPAIAEALAEADALLVSVQPSASGDPVLDHYGALIAEAPRLKRIAYLSTIGVYGDHGGAWIDEDVRPVPTSERGRARLVVEDRWLALGAHAGRQVAVLRLAGIYGPGRNSIEDLRDGSARRIGKPGQVSTASMSTTSAVPSRPRCCTTAWVAPGTSPTTSPLRHPTSWLMRRNCSAGRRRRSFPSTRRICRRWRRASTAPIAASRTAP